MILKFSSTGICLINLIQINAYHPEIEPAFIIPHQHIVGDDPGGNTGGVPAAASCWSLPNRESYDTRYHLKRILKRKFVIVIDQRGVMVWVNSIFPGFFSRRKVHICESTIWCHVTFGQSVTGQHPTVVNRDHMVRTIFILLKILKIVRKTRKLNHGVPHSYFQVKDIRARFQVTPEKSS